MEGGGKGQHDGDGRGRYGGCGTMVAAAVMGDTAISRGESTVESSECHMRHHKRDLHKEEAGEMEERLEVHEHCEV